MHQLAERLKQGAENIDGISFIGKVVSVSSLDALKKICMELKKDYKNYAAVLAADINGKAQVALLSDESVATAGGQDVSRLPEVIEQVRAMFE